MAKVRKQKTEEKSVKTPAKKIGKKGTIVIILLALIISVGTVVLSKVVLWPKYQEMKNHKKKEKVEKVKAVKPEIGEIYQLESFTVNTYQSAGRRFAKISLSLETYDKDVIPELEKRNPQIRSLMLKYFRSKTVDDLVNPTFPDSSAKDLIEQLNGILTSGRIANLYYQDLIVQ
eukprot:Anaeramoba_ignava/a217287_100.p4 GENE.a217287_100~~a217287_100.p4  ORF type:complete len:174 (-),score=21.32 a217287_100:2516-3037(-)